jgi:hypothetical protein
VGVVVGDRLRPVNHAQRHAESRMAWGHADLLFGQRLKPRGQPLTPLPQSIEKSALLRYYHMSNAIQM